MADRVDPEIAQHALTLFGPAFHVSRSYTPEHDGVDIAAAAGTPLHAIAAGKVSYARNSTEDREDPKRHWALGGGNVVNIDIPGRLTLQFAHLQSLDVKEGDAVVAGQLIGKVGATGRATGPHVHFGLWDHATNRMIRPHDYLATLTPAAPTPATPTPATPTPATPTPATPSAEARSTAPVVSAQIDDVERFPAPRHFRSRPGIILRGFDPARPDQIVRQQSSPTPSGAYAAAIVRIGWPDVDPQPMPNGTFLEVVNGLFQSLYILAADVDLDPPPGGPTGSTTGER